jgi:hypothetical protein
MNYVRGVRVRRERGGEMRIPDYARKCVGFIADKITSTSTVDTFDPQATGFFVMVDSDILPTWSFAYFVTAQHVAKKLNTVATSFIVNTVDGGVTTVKTGKAWYPHPTDASVDVAIIPCVHEKTLDVIYLQEQNFLDPGKIKHHMIGIGDEVFMMGLFTLAAGINRNMPIARMGNIAMFPEDSLPIDAGEGTVFAEVYLIEGRSIGGVSGSPVFVRKTLSTQVSGPDGSPTWVSMQAGEMYLLGMMRGHWDVRESEMNDYTLTHSQRGVNYGIATVVPAHKILEALNHPELIEGRKRDAEKMAAQLTKSRDGVE